MSNKGTDKPGNTPTDDELSKIDALIAQHSVNEVFDGPQLRFSASKQVRYGEQANKQAGVPSGGYRCHRCGEQGHFIQDCPMDESQARQAKTRQARGIPKTFLETVTEAQAAKIGGAFISADGDLVVMKSAGTEERLRMVGPSIDVALQRYFGKPWEEFKTAISCFICQDIVKDPVVTTCCGELFCRTCIMKHFDKVLIATDGGECPNCDHIGLSQVDLVTDRNVVALLAQVSGITERETGRDSVMISGPVQAKKQKVNTEMKIDVEMDSEQLEQTTTAVIPPSTTRISLASSVIVRGGRSNPFFEKNGPILSEEEFRRWQKIFRETLIQSGQGDMLVRRYGNSF